MYGRDHTTTEELLYYDLKPRYRRTSGLATACVVQCIATGEYLSGSGGPSYALSPDIVHALDMAHTGGKPRMVVDQEAWDGVLEALRAVNRDGGSGPRVLESATLELVTRALERAVRDEQ